MSQHPIADYALVGDCNGSALISRDGSVDWLCIPRFDSPSVLARLLDDRAGHWSLGLDGEVTAERRYLDQTMVLQTTLRTSGGTVTVTDAMALGPDNRGHELGKDVPHALLRSVTCESGRAQLVLEFAPRPGYGVDVPRIVPELGGAIARGDGDQFVLSAPVPLSVGDGTAYARLQLEAGQRVGFALQYAPAGQPAKFWTQREIQAGLEDTIEGWRSWSAIHQSYKGPWQDLVLHSGRVLQALMYRPTGAIVAAPTTSLPETVGGTRNWDYRYVWVRDASFTLRALWVAACPHEADRFFAFMERTAAAHVRAGTPLQIMFGIDGRRDLTERQLDHLCGWRGSRPVRIGNAAWSQLQLDVYGDLLDAAHRVRFQLGELDEPTRRFLIDLANGAAAHWQRPDQGIWEVRTGPQHFLYSKLMCWVALDRAIALADWLGATDQVPDWERTRAEIRAAIEQYGWNPHVGAYTQAFGSAVLDASALMMPLMGFAPATDARMRSTIETIRHRLTDHRGLVYRYLDTDDGLTGAEGTFLLCTFWLARCLALAGEVEEASVVFETAAGHANDVGLLAEEVDPNSGELLGNFPQAFSHIGLINAAWTISQAKGVRSGGQQCAGPDDGISRRARARALSAAA